MEELMEAQTTNFNSKLEGFKKPVGIPEDSKKSVVAPVVEDKPKRTRKSSKQEPIFEQPEDKVLTYAERLKEFNVTPEQAIAVIDDLISNDKYTETVKLSSKLNVVFSTRDVRFSHYLTQKLDALTKEELGMFSQLSSEYQVAGSLDKYGTQELPLLSAALDDKIWEENLNIRIKFVKALPNPAFLALTRKLAMFDMKMNMIMSEGYEENF